MDNIETKIGKDVIESLTIGMYEDSRFIYREYIQNAADQIDKAVEIGLLDSKAEGRIEIQINPDSKTISISDNATGIEAQKVLSVLKNIAQSTKDRAKNKGFRGIGRLGGLGYCDKLIFETSYRGEDSKSKLIWDAQKLKEIINDRSKREEASLVIDAVTSITVDKEDIDEHYFKVTLKNVSNTILLDVEKIHDYLSMVAPVPYSKGFIFKSKVYDRAKKFNYIIDEYPIYINKKNQVFKPYTTSIYEGDISNKKKFDEIHEIQFVDIYDTDSNVVAWGWFSIASLIKQIPKINTARAIRLRKGNIQIGLEGCLEKLFKETRGTYYFFGEIHAIHPELIPNARRDYFLENQTLFTFEKELKGLFSDLHSLYHFSSKVRNTKKKIDDYISFSEEFNKKHTKGFTDDKEKKEYFDKLESKKEKAQWAEQELNKFEEKSFDYTPAKKKVFDKIVGKEVTEIETIKIPKKDTKTKYITDELTSLSKKDRKLVSRIFGIIDNALPKDIANILKDKIKEELQ